MRRRNESPSTNSFHGWTIIPVGGDCAEAVYRDDLKRHPSNGWSYFGLSRALEAQKRGEEAAAARKQFDEAWELASTAF